LTTEYCAPQGQHNRPQGEDNRLPARITGPGREYPGAGYHNREPERGDSARGSCHPSRAPLAPDGIIPGGRPFVKKKTPPTVSDRCAAEPLRPRAGVSAPRGPIPCGPVRLRRSARGRGYVSFRGHTHGFSAWPVARVPVAAAGRVLPAYSFRHGPARRRSRNVGISNLFRITRTAVSDLPI